NSPKSSWAPIVATDAAIPSTPVRRPGVLEPLPAGCGRRSPVGDPTERDGRRLSHRSAVGAVCRSLICSRGCPPIADLQWGLSADR
ncbi:hypothetical protein, partial [Actinoplanes philippinensis]|uniref:hypothetical protein n=1 Tax=Actinoplanes philippinensis TaxID=35752 RepID=UPI0033EE7F83